MNRLTGKTAIVTGATSGIGHAIAEAFASEGANVVLAGRNEDRGHEIENDIRTADGKAFFVRTDVRVREDVKYLVAEALRVFGRVDVLVNNAGVMVNGLFEDHTEEDFNTLFETNFRGYLYTLWETLPLMRVQKSGSIINVASIMYAKANPGVSLYSACKAAIWQMTRCLAVEYAPHGVRLNLILPGPVRTGMIPYELGDTEDDIWPKVAATVPLGRVAEPEDIVGATVLLASDESAFITASSIKVDGGIL